MSKFWTTRELADAAGLSDGYVRYLLIKDKIHGEKLGRDWVVADEEVQRWLAERRKQDDVDEVDLLLEE